MNRRIAAVVAALFFGNCTLLSSPVFADTQLAPPPDKFVISAGGVDMRSGRYAYTHTDLSIGGDSGLELSRTLGQLGISHPNRFGSFSDNFDIFVQEISVNNQTGDYRPNAGQDPQIEVLSGGLAQTFRYNSSNTSAWDLVSRAGYGILTPAPNAGWSSGSLTYQGSDGTTMVFRPINSSDCPAGAASCGDISQLTRADGTVLTFAYDSDPTSGGTRLRSVTSTRGQAILFEYSGMYVTKSCAINLSTTPMPAPVSCPAGVPTAIYTYDWNAGSQRLASVTDPTGAVWQFVNGTMTDTTNSDTPATITMGFVNPGETSPWLTNNIHLHNQDDGSVTEVITHQSFSDGRSYTYGYYSAPPDAPHVPVLAGGTITDGQGHVTQVVYDFPVLPNTGPGGTGSCPIGTDFCSPTQTQINPDGSTSVVYQMTAGPVSVTDPLGRTTTSDYCDRAATNGCVVDPDPESMTDPSGIVTNMTWDFALHHLVKTDEVARPGSGLADIVRQEGYACLGAAQIKSCDEPSALIDANGKETDFTYDPQHGGVVTEMDPPPSSGAARPLKLTTWTQKYAYILSGGSLAPAASPVWVKATETVCQTVAGANNGNPVCDTAAQQRVTTYQYGDGQANSLLVRGIAVTADGTTRRTCYSYDNFGNRISQTSARAGLTSCP